MRTETKSRILFTVLAAPLVALSFYWLSIGLTLWGGLVLLGSVAVLIWVWWPKAEIDHKSAEHAGGHETKKHS